MDIQKFIERFKHTFVYELLSETLTDEQLFEHVIDKDGAVIWFKDQTRQMWFMWQAAKAQAVPEGFVFVPKELSIEDARKHAETMFNKVEQMARYEQRDLTEIEFNTFKTRWLEASTLTIQHDWKAMIEVQEKNMNNQVCIGRHINGISINPLEYLLDESGQVKLFADEAAAKAHLAELGYSDEDAYWMVFKAQEQGQ